MVDVKRSKCLKAVKAFSWHWVSDLMQNSYNVNLTLYAFISQFPFPFWIVSPDLSLFPLNILPSLPLYSLYVLPFPNVSPPNLSLSLPLYHKLSSINLCILPDFKMDLSSSLPLFFSSPPITLHLATISLHVYSVTPPFSHFQVFHTVSSFPLCYWTLHCQSFIDFILSNLYSGKLDYKL